MGILPDVFLNHTVDTADQVFPAQLTPPRNLLETITYPFRWIWRQFEIIFQVPVTIREKTFKHTWTGNLDLPGVGDCNIHALVTIEGVGAAQTYSPCSTNLRDCEIKWYPESAAVGPAIADTTVKEWPMHRVADAGLSPELIGGVMLLGLDCAGDICEPPPCLQQNPYDEFYEGPDRSCLDFDPEREGWRSTGPGIGDAYLVGRGNLYIGPRGQPAFEVVADSDTTGVQIDHWIANDNPGAVILVTPRGNHGSVAGFFGVKYERTTGRWSIIAKTEETPIAAGSKFNVYVMGDRGRGSRVRAFGGETMIWLDDPLLNKNPNALAFATHVVDEVCRERVTTGGIDNLGGFVLNPGERPESDWVCSMSYFPHPIGVMYDSMRQQWALISEDGTNFKSPIAYNIVVAGLAGKYRSDDWLVDQIPDYAGRLESVHARPARSRMPLSQLDAADENSIIFVMHNMTPDDQSTLAGARNLSPVGVTFQEGQWYVRNLDDQDMPRTAFNTLIPLSPP